jgi:C1A family cysteine protease
MTGTCQQVLFRTCPAVPGVERWLSLALSNGRWERVGSGIWQLFERRKAVSDTWGNLTESERLAVSAGARKLSEQELQDRFVKREDKVTFRIQRRTGRALAGELDIDLAAEEPTPLAAEAEVAIAPEEIMPLEMAMAEEVDEFETVEITLISPEDFDYEPEISEEDEKAAEPIDERVRELAGYFGQDTVATGEEAALAMGDAETAGLPAVVDHRAQQSPIKDQGGRGTCVAHASMGVLEAFAHIPDDLSEQCAHYKFNEFMGRAHNQDAGLKTTNAAPYLARADGRVCLEANWPYIPNQSTINTMVAAGAYGPPAACLSNQTYGIGSYKIITDKGLTGESIKNTRYLEALLYQGYNVVIGTWVSWDDKDNDGVLDPVLDPSGKPVGTGGHAMLVVGYDRTAQYFIVKNSWGPGWGHSGYAYLHYNLIRSCFKYGYVVDSVVPAAPTRLPAKLLRAPYSASKISRSKLRTAVLFLKTSQGRYAVCEAYAGYNLLLRNLRVYNADGSLHLERDRLLIRGTFLCDIDSARETSSDADFWWEAVRPGVNYLVPRNGAQAWVAFDLAALNAQQIGGMPLNSAPIPSENLDYAVVVGRTTANRRFKMLVHAKPGNKLQLSYLELYAANGSRYRYATKRFVSSSWTYNLDTLRQGGGRYADIWWHVISDGVGFLERYSTAKTRFVWCL